MLVSALRTFAVVIGTYKFDCAGASNAEGMQHSSCTLGIYSVVSIAAIFIVFAECGCAFISEHR